MVMASTLLCSALSSHKYLRSSDLCNPCRGHRSEIGVKSPYEKKRHRIDS